ncbi:hypothetical protein RJT34_18885 [Clitoria ternatea]|uniref:Uncharacterized protein n=1 Tax=Clitoria ternatea TaxID=43366 RepID=A0AAN9IQ08_CLITE
MGCFLHCFGSSKRTTHRRRTHHHHRNASCREEHPEESTIQDYSKTVLSTESQVQAKTEEQLHGSTRKKVTFDVNVKTYEPVLIDEVTDFQLEKSGEGGKEEPLVDNSKSNSEESSVTSTGSYPTNHRYHSCSHIDDEDGEMDYWDSELTDEDDGDGDSDMEEEYDEVGQDFEEGIVSSLLRNGAKEVFVEEVESSVPMCDKDVKSIGLNNPNARDRSVYVHPVLNPVENLTQWKAVKAKRTPPLVSQKENFILNQESQTVFGGEEPSKKLNKEIAVDASLSNWLASSETTPVKNKANSLALYSGTPDRSSSQGSNSVISHEDRPILGALTVEELKQFSASSSPRKSPCRGMDDEMPIIGSVGSYWNSDASAEDSSSATSFKGVTHRASSRGVHLK